MGQKGNHRETGKYFGLNVNENTTSQNLCDRAKQNKTKKDSTTNLCDSIF